MAKKLSIEAEMRAAQRDMKKKLSGEDKEEVKKVKKKAKPVKEQYKELQESLKEKGIPSAIHYPMPLHLQECFIYLGYKKGDFPISEQVGTEIMSLPMSPFLTQEQQDFVVNAIKA